MKKAAKMILIICCLWLICELGLRVAVEWPLKRDFYGSISKDEVLSRQVLYGVRVANGPGWSHLGWIADPDSETYLIEKFANGTWIKAGVSEYGSYLITEPGRFRVMAVLKNSVAQRLLGETETTPGKPAEGTYTPQVSGKWKTLFKPKVHGNYINDHAIYRDAYGNWRLLGITSLSDGVYSLEKYLAVGVSRDFPPADGMRESVPVADFGKLAWAPDVVEKNGKYYMFYSPHRLELMKSEDGVAWEDNETVIKAPFHKFFRDAMILEVADNQWLLYTTARGRFFSRVDLYQSFDLKSWQYIGPALETSWGSERNSPFASTESPFVIDYKGGYYLSITYNNDTPFWNGLLLPFKIWIDKPSYNDTLIFHSANPYNFGIYKGKKNSPSLIARLDAHAPEYVYVSEKDNWYITTCGWPWIATLTKGEAAVAPLEWKKSSGAASAD